MVILENVAVGYRRRAVLEGVTLRIGKGESVGLLGANGSGKTTLLKTIGGILPTVKGEVRFGAGGRPTVGYVPQRESLDQAFMLSNLEVVLMGVCGRVGPGRFAGKRERAQAIECLEKTGAANLAGKRFAEVSGGQKQRVLIARALMARPDLLLLDEPTAGVDAAATAAITELLRNLNAEGMTVLMVNHDVPVLRSVARSIWWVADKKVETGTVSEMLRAERLEHVPID